MDMPFTFESLKTYLVEYCDCIYCGQEIPPPYADQDDMPHFMKHPDGTYFTLPLPDNDDGTYTPAVVEKYIVAQNIVQNKSVKSLSQRD